MCAASVFNGMCVLYSCLHSHASQNSLRSAPMPAVVNTCRGSIGHFGCLGWHN